MPAKPSVYLKREESKLRDPSLHTQPMKSSGSKLPKTKSKSTLSKSKNTKSISKGTVSKTKTPKSKILEANGTKDDEQKSAVSKKSPWDGARFDRSRDDKDEDDDFKESDNGKPKVRLCFVNKREKESNEKELIEVTTDEIGRFDTNVENLYYFHGFLAREEAEELLVENGDFLIRECEYNRLSHYVISAQHKGQIHHILVKTTRTKKLYWTCKYAFKSIVELAIYHNRCGIAVYKEIVLTRGIGKQSWQFNHEQIELKTRLGEGMFGEVYRGLMKTHVTKSGIVVAVKRLSGISLSGKEKQEFLQEARVMLSMKHENVTQLFGVCTMRQPIMLVLEFCEKGSLDSILIKSEPKLSMSQKVKYLYHTACGLDYIHEKTVIHRDIAARNCLVTRKNVIKISDFGLSRRGTCLTEKNRGHKPYKYMAPEAIKPGIYSAASDMFSYTALIFEVLLDGQMPYEDKMSKAMNPTTLVRRLAKFEYRLKFEPPSDTPPYLIDIYNQCRVKNPDRRLSAARIMSIFEIFEKECVPIKPETFLQRMKEKCRDMLQDFRM